jgi:polysaccharide export outer membrane protein
MSRFLKALIACLCLTVVACSNVQRNDAAQSVDRIQLAEVRPAGPSEFESEYRYRLSYGDEIEVRYLSAIEYSTSEVVGLDGTVKLPFLPAIRVEGLTLDETALELERRYREIISSSPKPDDKIYLIGVGDILEVRFPYVSQYSSTVGVRPDGRISLPLAGAVVAEGKDPGTLQRELEAFYARHLDQPELVLNVLKAASNVIYRDGKRRVAVPEMDSLHVTLKSGLDPMVYVGGEVGAPSALQYRPMMSSLQAIVAAGGETRRSDLSNVIILRKGLDGTPRYIVRDLQADIDGDPSEDGSGLVVTNDLTLRPFDVVIVPRTAIATVSDVLDAYLYDLLPMLRNSSIGFNYQIGTMKVEQDTKVKTRTIDDSNPLPPGTE